MNDGRRWTVIRSALAVAVVWVAMDALLQGEVRLGSAIGAIGAVLLILALTYHPGPLPATPAKAAAVALTAAFVALAVWIRL